MATQRARHALFSVEEYLEMEKTSSVRHEYVAGEVYAMSGASKRHNRISFNIARGLFPAADAQGCRVYVNDVKVRAAEDVIYYPDVMVACGPDVGDEYVEEAPCLIVEVASPSTTGTDQREKLMAYKRIPGLRAYLIVHQDRRRIQHIHCDEQGRWSHDDAVGRGLFRLARPELRLTIDEVYESTGVEE